MKHFYENVPRLGNVAVSRHAQAQMIEAGISQEAFDRVLLEPTRPDIPDGADILWRERDGLRLVILINPTPNRGAKLISTTAGVCALFCLRRRYGAMSSRSEAEDWAEELEAVAGRIALRFGRAEPRRRALAYLQGLLAPLERKNGWHLAEAAGDPTPDGMQEFLARVHWDADALRDDLRAYVVEHLG